MKLPSRILVCLLSLSLLASCGWQLRGSQQLTGVSAVYISAKEDNKGLARVLKHELAAQNIEIASTGSEASYSIVLVNQSKSRRTLSLSGNAKASEYMLTETVEFLILSPEGEKLSQKQSASVSRAIDNDEFRPMASLTEEKALQKEMWQALSQKIIRALNSASS